MASPNWRATRNGGQRIKRNECIIVISERHSFGYWNKRGATEWPRWGVDTEEEAKRAAFYKWEDIIKGD